MTNLTSGKETEKADSEEPEPVLDPEREKERVDDEAAEELLVKKKEDEKKEDAVFTEEIVPSEIEKKVVSERMEAEAKESDKVGAGGVRRNSKGKNRGGNKGKKKKEKM